MTNGTQQEGEWLAFDFCAFSFTAPPRIVCTRYWWYSTQISYRSNIGQRSHVTILSSPLNSHGSHLSLTVSPCLTHGAQRWKWILRTYPSHALNSCPQWCQVIPGCNFHGDITSFILIVFPTMFSRLHWVTFLRVISAEPHAPRRNLEIPQTFLGSGLRFWQQRQFPLRLQWSSDHYFALILLLDNMLGYM